MPDPIVLEAVIGGECCCYYGLATGTNIAMSGDSNVLKHITDLSRASSRDAIDTSTRASYPDKTEKPAARNNEVTFTLMNWKDESGVYATDVKFVRDAVEDSTLVQLAVLDGPGGNGYLFTGYFTDDNEDQGLSNPHTWSITFKSALARQKVVKGVVAT